MNRNSKKKKIEVAEALTSDDEQQKWEQKSLGNDPRHSEALEVNLGDIEKPTPTSIRLPTSLINDLKRLAKDEGLPYQTYLKMILTRHVKTNKAS